MGKLTRQAAIVLLFSLFAGLTLASPALAASEVFLSTDTAQSEVTYVIQFDATVKGNLDKIRIALPPGTNAANARLGRLIIGDKVFEGDDDHKNDAQISLAGLDTLIVDLNDERSVKVGTKILIELFNLNNPVAGNYGIDVRMLDKKGNVLEVVPPMAFSTYTEVGPQGPKGDKGDPGPQGPKGDAGATGSVGATGPAGPQGLAGAAGPTGPKGDTGATGAQGPQGVAGPAGPIGLTGPQGLKGDKGDTGLQGPIGPKGDAGQVSLASLVGSPCIFRAKPGTVQVSITEAVTDLGVPLNIGDIHLTCLPPPPPPPSPAPDTATLKLALRALFVGPWTGGNLALSVRVTNISPAPLSGPNNIVSSSPATGTCSAVGAEGLGNASVACAYAFLPGSTVTVTIEALVDGPGISGDQVNWNPANGCPRSSGSGPLVASCTIALPLGNSVTSLEAVATQDPI